MSKAQPERFTPTSGRIIGVVGLLLAVVVLVLGVIDPGGIADWVMALALLGGVLAWSAMLRPRVSLVGDDLELRNMLETIHIPLAAIEELAIRQLMAVRVGDKRFLSPALGKSRRQLRDRPSLGSRLTSRVEARGTVDYPSFVEERIRQRMADARAARGIRLASDEQLALARDVRRQPAWPEIIALVLSLVAFVTAVVF